MLHLLNKSEFIILLETADSFKMFCTIVSLYILIQEMRSIWITQILWWILLTVLEASLPPFCGLLCSSLSLYYFENDIYIFMLVWNNYTLVILACKLYVPCVAQILSYV
jgi:hypothetical protein